MWNQDWEQYRKNLEIEREAWSLYEARRELAKEQAQEAIERKREEIEKGKKELEEAFKKYQEKKLAEYRRKERWAHREYIRTVEKKFKPTVSL